ncbi:S8 family serine peptidase [Microvirga sp. HBU67558]|uniref:S8 family serine peptidase n=1 Tax=Microvirga TaxID=186650 RepID=UPI001B38972C|nr:MULTISPECIES: S8 family serine peptidase [unclassified Microvirga]MBQ0822683.1 S8 family serine peptidase [Microvirga sp. HBU67558]
MNLALFRRLRMFLLVVLSLSAIGICSADEGPPRGTKDPYKIFRDSLKHSNGRFLLNGYWLSELELKVEWERLSRARFERALGLQPADEKKERRDSYHPDLSLNVNVVNGELDYWVLPEERTLTYAIDKASFTQEQYAVVARAMIEAGGDWERACLHCGIRFVHRPEFDVSPDSNKVKFVVRYTKDPTEIVATSFLPSSPPDARIISIGETFFKSTLSPAGVLRHQLGHVLGYRHEHISPEAGPNCPQIEPPTYVTGSYDPQSVMHYQCGGGGSLEMKLSDRDIKSHQLVYGFATVMVELEGKQVLSTASNVIRTIVGPYKRLPYQEYNLGDEEGCRTYIRDLGLSEAVTSEQSRGAAACNPFLSLRRDLEGKRQYPILTFNSSVDIASGSILQRDVAAVRDFEQLMTRVDAIRLDVRQEDPPAEKRRQTSRTDQRIITYEIEWRQYVASIPVSQIELKAITQALEPLAQKDPGISVTVEDGLAKSLTTRRGVNPNAVAVSHAVSSRDAICAAGAMGHYGMLLEELPYEEKKMPNSGIELPDLKCDFDTTAEASCGACSGSCETLACQHCSVCNRSEVTPVLFEESIDQGALTLSSSPPQCAWKPFDRRHHGTLMAQIIAGSNRFVGFVPGVLPQLISNAPGLREKEIYDNVRNLYSNKRNGVAILTSQMCYEKSLLDEFAIALPNGSNPCEIPGDVSPQVGDIPSQDAARSDLLKRHIGRRRISQSHDWLWVAAIGQPTNASQVAQPSKTTTFGAQSIALPAALADESNVVLVSACERCSLQRADAANRKVWPRAHRGSGAYRPHIIAPGGVDYVENLGGEWVGGLPGFGVGNEPIRAYGTSQAAAYVGGLATKMRSCYSRYYRVTSRLKEALQLTSMPVLPADNSNDHVATGLADVKLALLHPGYIYLQQQAEAERTYSRVSISDFKWCSDTLQVRTASAQEYQPIPVEYVRRIVQIPLGGAKRWVIYHKDDNTKPGVVLRSPLVAASTSPSASDPVLQIGSKALRLSEIQDLVLFDDPGVSGQCGGQ